MRLGLGWFSSPSAGREAGRQLHSEARTAHPRVLEVGVETLQLSWSLRVTGQDVEVGTDVFWLQARLEWRRGGQRGDGEREWRGRRGDEYSKSCELTVSAGQLSPGQLSSGSTVARVNCRRVNCRRVNCRRVNCRYTVSHEARENLHIFRNICTTFSQIWCDLKGFNRAKREKNL